MNNKLTRLDTFIEWRKREKKIALIDDALEELTNREYEVTNLVCEGLSSKQIAYELGVSCRTVENHRISAMAKLGVSNVALLVRRALIGI